MDASIYINAILNILSGLLCGHAFVVIGPAMILMNGESLLFTSLTRPLWPIGASRNKISSHCLSCNVIFCTHSLLLFCPLQCHVHNMWRILSVLSRLQQKHFRRQHSQFFHFQWNAIHKHLPETHCVEPLQYGNKVLRRQCKRALACHLRHFFQRMYRSSNLKVTDM